MSNIPSGTTHVELANPHDFDQRPTFLRYDLDFRGPESGTFYNCWYIWHQGAWHKDYGYQQPKDKARFIGVVEYNEDAE